MDEDEKTKRDDRNEKLKCKRDNGQGDMSKRASERNLEQNRTERKRKGKTLCALVTGCYYFYCRCRRRCGSLTMRANTFLVRC